MYQKPSLSKALLIGSGEYSVVFAVYSYVIFAKVAMNYVPEMGVPGRKIISVELTANPKNSERTVEEGVGGVSVGVPSDAKNKAEPALNPLKP